MILNYSELHFCMYKNDNRIEVEKNVISHLSCVHGEMNSVQWLHALVAVFSPHNGTKLALSSY